MANKRETIIVGSVLLAIAIGYGYMTTQLPTRNLPNTLGLDAMPKMFAIFLAFLSVLLIIGALVGDKNKESKAPEKVRLTWPQARGVIVTFAVLAAYIILIDVVGFLIVTPVVVFTLMYMEGVRKYVWMVVAAVVTTGAVYGLFRFVFEVRITGIAFL